MKKFVINLVRRFDRKENFLLRNSSLGDVQFIEAIDGKEITHQILINSGFDTNRLWRDPFHNRKLTRGEVACFLSHARAWKHCVDLQEPIMVFEDDAVVLETIDEDYITSLTKKYDFIYLSRNENEPENVIEVDDKLEIPAYPYNMTSYVITPQASKAFLESGILKQIIPVDEFLPKVIRQINTVAFKKDLVNQESRETFGSDIEPYSEEEWFIDFNVHPITVGDDRKRCVQLNTSATMHGIYPKNLGTNVEWKGTDMSGPGGGMKINLLKEYIKTLPDHDVVLFTDAFDVFYADNLQSIVRRYLGFNTRALFSAESECYPDKSLAEKYPQSETPYRFLNSGTFISEVGELKRILNDEIADDGDDQLYYTKRFISGNHDMKLDYEGYIFRTNEPQTEKQGSQIYNPRTKVFSCIYHGNGGVEAKKKFNSLYNEFYPKAPSLWIPNKHKYDIIEKDMLVVDFMTQAQCEDLIDIADRHGGWGSLSYDKFPAQEIRMKELGFWNELERHWIKNIYPIVEKYWSPIEMYGLRDAFVMRYAMDTQVSLAYHNDASLVTGSVKLNDDYEGAELVYHRQGISNKDIAVGRCILFPGMVTHGHECLPLKSGVKYSLTMWTSRYHGDVGG
jgi:GR25 family glycosyltransferase involved in LPS biosynthesis